MPLTTGLPVPSTMTALDRSTADTAVARRVLRFLARAACSFCVVMFVAVVVAARSGDVWISAGARATWYATVSVHPLAAAVCFGRNPALSTPAVTASIKPMAPHRESLQSAYSVLRPVEVVGYRTGTDFDVCVTVSLPLTVTALCLAGVSGLILAAHFRRCRRNPVDSL